MTLREAKQTIRQWIRTHFDDQRLAEVYAFNEDKRMGYRDPHSCIIGVTFANRLHQGDAPCNFDHVWAAGLLPFAHEVASAYLELSFNCWRGYGDSVARRRLRKILLAEMKWREQNRMAIKKQLVAKVTGREVSV